MNSAKSVPIARFPVKFLTVTVFLTGAVLTWLGWSTYHSYRLTKATAERGSKIERLRGTIIHLDEVLTMSARMAVSTGDLQWEKRYRDFEPALDDAIKEAIRLAPDAYSVEAARRTDAANVELVAMENRAFDLVRRGRLEEARSVLFSKGYEDQKRVYAMEMEQFADRLGAATSAVLHSAQKKVLLNVAVVVAVIFALLVAWVLVLRTMGRWRATLLANYRQLAEQADALVELNRNLDQKVAERTKELEASQKHALEMLEKAEQARHEAEQAEQALQAKQQLLGQLLDVHERHRQLVAYEIHDGLTQPLVGALMSFESLQQFQHQQPDFPWDDFQAAVQLLRQSLDEARQLMSGLRPPVLDESGIVAAVDFLVHEFQKRGTAKIEFVHHVKFQRLAPPLEDSIFRIIQETLTNACRHSQSDNVRVELAQQGDRLRIAIRDWGIGFDPDKVERNRFGLRGIRERARLLGGQASIDTGPGRGTEVVVDLPLVMKATEETGGQQLQGT